MSEPKPIRAWAAWHPTHGYDYGRFRPTAQEGEASIGMRARSEGWRIIPVEILPVKDVE